MSFFLVIFRGSHASCGVDVAKGGREKILLQVLLPSWPSNETCPFTSRSMTQLLHTEGASEGGGETDGKRGRRRKSHLPDQGWTQFFSSGPQTHYLPILKSILFSRHLIRKPASTTTTRDRFRKPQKVPPKGDQRFSPPSTPSTHPRASTPIPPPSAPAAPAPPPAKPLPSSPPPSGEEKEEEEPDPERRERADHILAAARENPS
jgi:hypothetical protein